MNKIAELKFESGNITEIVDFKKNFGDLMYITHKKSYVYEGDEGNRTQEHDGFEMIVLSSVNGKTYKVKFDDTELDFSNLKMQEVVELKNPVVTQYVESGAKSQGIAVSIKAEGLITSTAPKTNISDNKPTSQPTPQQKPNNK